MNKGTLLQQMHKKRKLMVDSWIDKKPVVMLSTHSLQLDPEEECYYALRFSGHRIHLYCGIVCITNESCTIECVNGCRGPSVSCVKWP